MRAAARCTWRVQCSRPRWAISRSTRCSPRPAADRSRATAIGIPARPRTSASPARARTSGSRSRSKDDEAWAALLRVAGSNAALDRDEWQTAAGRLADVDALEAAVGEWTQLWDAQTLQARLQRAGVAAGVVHSTLSHLTDPQLEARGWWRFLEHPDTGVRRYGGFPWRFSRTPASVTRPAPRLGEHTVEILGWVAGSQRGRDRSVARGRRDRRAYGAA